MKNTKTINMTGYTVEYVDLRQSKPRTVNKAVSYTHLTLPTIA